MTWFWYGLSVSRSPRRSASRGAAGWPSRSGGYGLAWSAGLLALGLVPVGIGVREAVLTAALLPVLPVGAATAVAVASRVVQTLGDAHGAGIAAVLSRSVRRAAAGAVDGADESRTAPQSISTTR